MNTSTPRSIRIQAQRPCPDGFTGMAGAMTYAELCQHFSAGVEIVRRWSHETGVVIGSTRERRSRGRIPTPKTPRTRKAVHWKQISRPVVRTQTDCSRPGMAAEYLRRFGPVYRCTALGRFDLKGDMWRRGSVVLTDDEIIDRALANGWAPDAWKAIA